MKRARPSKMAQNQTPMIFCGEIKAGQDVSISLVPDANNQQVTNLCNRGTLAELKVHSTELKNCSKYFEGCLCERQTNPNSMHFNLEVIHGLQVGCYIDCFSRMYTPFCKDFEDVKSSLQLLRVASQIEFHELISSIFEYLSIIDWSVEDELRIRQYSSSSDFARSQAKDLVARLASAGPNKEDGGRDLVCDLMEKAMCIALQLETRYLHSKILSFKDAQSFFDELFSSIGQCVYDPTFERNMVKIVSNVAKEMLVEFHEECRKKATVDRQLDVDSVPGFGSKLGAICWILKTLLRAQVAEDVIECFIHLELQPLILQGAIHSRFHHYNVHAIEFASLVLLIHREAVAGNLALGIPEKIVLLENWNLIHTFHDLRRYAYLFNQDRHDQILVLRSAKREELITQAREDVFLTLPFQQQMELLEHKMRDNFPPFITPASLARLLKQKWPVEDASFHQIF